MGKKIKEKEQEQEVELKIQDPAEEQKKLEASLDVIPLCKEKSDVPFYEATEKERKNIFVIYKKSRLENNIIMGITVAVFAASMFVFTQFPSW